jgi:hypothetical protein
MKAAVQGSIKICGDHFPETMGATFIINAPWYFRTIWVIIRSFIDARTAKKVFVSSNTSDLSKLIDPEMLPLEYGGSGALGLKSIKDLSSNNYIDYILSID